MAARDVASDLDPISDGNLPRAHTGGTERKPSRAQLQSDHKPLALEMATGPSRPCPLCPESVPRKTSTMVHGQCNFSPSIVRLAGESENPVLKRG